MGQVVDLERHRRRRMRGLPGYRAPVPRLPEPADGAVEPPAAKPAKDTAPEPPEPAE